MNSFILNCSKCKSKLASEVYMLQCMHSYCKPCKESIRSINMICVLCNSITKNDNIVRNVFFEKIALYRKLLDEGHNENINCEMCSPEISTSEKYCVDCEQYFCLKCSLSHLKIKQCRNHSIVEKNNFDKIVFKNQSPKCEKHILENLTMYCIDCDSLICATCCAMSHVKHNKEDNLGVAFESSKHSLEQKLEQIEHLIQSQNREQNRHINIERKLIHKAARINRKIDARAEQLKKSIDSMKANLLNNLFEYKNKYIKLINEKNEKRNSYLKELNNLKVSLELVIKNESDFDKFNYKNDLERIDWIYNNKPHNLSCLDLSYFKGDQKELNCNEFFGQLRDSKNFEIQNEVTSSCVINNYLYAMDHENRRIDIYDIESTKFQLSIDCKQYIRPNYTWSTIISVSNHLFIYCDFTEADTLLTIIYKYNWDSFVQWKLMKRCRLSSTKSGTILAKTSDADIIEFSIKYQKLKKFKLPSEVNCFFSWGCNEVYRLNYGRYIITGFHSNSVVISLLNADGTFIKSFTKNTNALIYICTDGENIFLLERSVELITVLSNNLDPIKEFNVPKALNILFDNRNEKITIIKTKSIEYFDYNLKFNI